MHTYKVLTPCFLDGVLHSPLSDTHNTYNVADKLSECPKCLELIQENADSQVEELSPQQKAAITRKENKLKKSDKLKEIDAQVEEL